MSYRMRTGILRMANVVVALELIPGFGRNTEGAWSQVLSGRAGLTGVAPAPLRAVRNRPLGGLGSCSSARTARSPDDIPAILLWFSSQEWK